MENRVLFYSSVSTKSLFQTQKFYKIDIELLKQLGYTVYTSNRLLDFLFFWKYTVAFIYFYRKGLVGAMIAKILLKKVYFTGGIDSLDPSISLQKEYQLQNLLFKVCRKIADCCILVSTSDANNIRNIYHGKLPKKLSLSPHTIDVQSFQNTSLEKTNIFVTIAWMESIKNVVRKGLDSALIVFKSLLEKQEFKDSVFYIVGKEGEGSNYLRQKCTELEIQNRVRFTGTLTEEDKINLLLKSKFYFQLSTYEGFGIAALEALAAKNIVIHSGQGGLFETMKDFGIILDIKLDFYDQLPDLYRQIVSFDMKKLELAQNYLREYYQHERRLNDLNKIMKPVCIRQD